MSLHIRETTPADLPAIYDLLTQLDEHVHSQHTFNLPIVQRAFEHMDAAPEFYLNLVGVVEERIVGFISLIFYKTPTHAGGTALINELVVSREARRAGVGRALIERARQEAISRGLDELEVATEKDNLPAQSFYRRCGFDEEYVLFGMEFDR